MQSHTAELSANRVGRIHLIEMREYERKRECVCVCAVCGCFRPHLKGFHVTPAGDRDDLVPKASHVCT